VKRLADGFRRSRYDVKSLMRDVFMSPEFVAPTTYRALVKSPTELMVHMAKALETAALAKAIGLAGQGMGPAPLRSARGRRLPVERELDLEQQRAHARELRATTLTGMAKIPAFKDAHTIHLDGVVSPRRHSSSTRAPTTRHAGSSFSVAGIPAEVKKVLR